MTNLSRAQFFNPKPYFPGGNKGQGGRKAKTY
jgi:hypothetical protein